MLHGPPERAASPPSAARTCPPTRGGRSRRARRARAGAVHGDVPGHARARRCRPDRRDPRSAVAGPADRGSVPSAPRLEVTDDRPTAAGACPAEEIVRLSRAAHVLLVVGPGGRSIRSRSTGRRASTSTRPEGERILDFNSQLMSRQHRPWRPARHRCDHRAGEQALQYVQPAFVTEIRARLGASWPRSCRATWTRSSSPSAAPRPSRTRSSSPATTAGRHKILARYRSYHGATLGAMTLTGDPRRWANEPGIVGVVRYPDTHRWGEKEPRPVAESAPGPRGRDPVRGPPHDRGGLPRDDRRHERDPDPARRLPRRASARSATGTAS